MARPAFFDLLIVYTQRLAVSARAKTPEVFSPFPQGSRSETYSPVYAYFLKICEKYGLKAAFTTSRDIVGAGKCTSYWLFEHNRWVKVNQPAFSRLIFDKFSPVNRRIQIKRELLFSSPQIKSFNPPRLFKLFFDKYQAYKKLARFSIPTVALEDRTLDSLANACRKLKAIIRCHPHREDFSDELIVKDRFGAGGLNIFRLGCSQPERILGTIWKCRGKSFIIQPFVKFDRGFSYNHTPASTDIRLIFLDGKIVQTYLRMAKPGDFRCNEHQGGVLKYVARKEIPQMVVRMAKEIALGLNHKRSLFALDFIISNHGHVYLLEGNTGPGLDWNLTLKENELEAKKLIRLVVKELAGAAGKSKISKHRTAKALSKGGGYAAVPGLALAV